MGCDRVLLGLFLLDQVKYGSKDVVGGRAQVEKVAAWGRLRRKTTERAEAMGEGVGAALVE